MLRPLPLDTPITFLAFSYAGRKALSAEKLLIFCSAELQISCDGRSEYRVSVSLYIGLASYLFLSVPLRYGADSAPGAFLPLYVYIIADVLDNVNIFYKYF